MTDIVIGTSKLGWDLKAYKLQKILSVIDPEGPVPMITKSLVI